MGGAISVGQNASSNLPSSHEPMTVRQTGHLTLVATVEGFIRNSAHSEQHTLWLHGRKRVPRSASKQITHVSSSAWSGGGSGHLVEGVASGRMHMVGEGLKGLMLPVDVLPVDVLTVLSSTFWAAGLGLGVICGGADSEDGCDCAGLVGVARAALTAEGGMPVFAIAA